MKADLEEKQEVMVSRERERLKREMVQEKESIDDK